MTERRKIGQELARRVRLASVVLEENGRLRAEVARLRLTDQERAAIERAAKDENEHGLVYTADVLESLLERTK